MAKIISIRGKYEQFPSNLKFEDTEKELPVLHINADYIVSINETVVTKRLGDQDIEKNIRCIARKGRLSNIYTNESIEQIIVMVNIQSVYVI